ncbi:A disintegrin and metalloproteinase with thrombospondin motifs 3-like [Dreissena polymorpha]|uniref:A disintegrin and metalloproteinase with thrombospondin motifs 3-like n=1 Tax=Dreissena polymorpha TaxID=45954 RepID=UPI00226414A3|nr:A disintegrin and metalloproteinase with thrombospondin motifs 3-like [Dreissena polymorpha]
MRFLRENDFSAEKSLVKMHQYYNYLFAMVNQRYETIDDKTFSIQIQVCDMLIAKSRRQVAWFEGIARWSKNHGNHVTFKFIFSYILCKRRKKVEGYAHVGTMCDVTSGKSSSIVHDGGDFLSAAVIAHELAHRSSKSKCLLTAPKKLFNYDNDARFPGKTVDINSQCRFSFSESSSFCDAGSQRYSVCERLWCASPSEGGLCRTKSRLTALPGTPCGFGRHCNLGKCISSYTPTFMSAFQSVRVDSSLLFADRNCRAEPPKCSTLVRASPKLCTRERYQEYCCKSCSNPYTI